MYANNVFSKRRPDGWVERRRRFERTAEPARTDEAKSLEVRPDASEKPKR